MHACSSREKAGLRTKRVFVVVVVVVCIFAEKRSRHFDEMSSLVPPSSIHFPSEEEKILELWKELDAFKTCLKQSSGKPRFSFNDGPPFATGLPHYGHILAGTIKDIIPRSDPCNHCSIPL